MSDRRVGLRSGNHEPGAERGAAGLSLRAVARDLGMASSAIYRYFPSRDALLTALIIESYDALGDACEQAHAAVEEVLGGRFGGARVVLEERLFGPEVSVLALCDGQRALPLIELLQYALDNDKPVTWGV